MKKIKGFTMIEILIVSILISVWLLSVANAINHANLVNHRVLQSVIANQIATEWAEIVYEKRNTNFLQYYYNNWNGQIGLDDLNACRLAFNFLNCAKEDRKCESPWWDEDETNANRTIMNKWYYFISTSWWINTIHRCIERIHGTGGPNGKSCSDIRNDIYAICLKNWVRSACTNEDVIDEAHNNWLNVWHNYWRDESHYGKFYRMIEWIWIYNMDSDETWGDLVDSSFCFRGEAQEYRFCSRVARDWWQWWEIEICSTMTNFAEVDGNVVR
jgi:prepilin-type N-terminal cleavage/methylation domain-containing protein